jgi:uncharacterized protein
MSKKKYLILGLVVVGGCAFGPLHRFEQSMVFQPKVYPKGFYGGHLPCEDVWFQSEDGTKLHGWFTSPTNPRAVLLYCHGNGGNISHRRDTIRELRERHQVAVFIFDYRGYGRSEGTPSEAGLVADAKAARGWVANRTGIGETDVVLFGRSLGGGVAVQLAADDGAAGLVLVSTFASLPEVAAHRMPFLAPKLIMRNRFPSADRIPEFQGPVLVCHGDADRVVPYSQGQKLFEAANEPKRFVHIDGGGHNDPDSGKFHAELEELLNRTPGN